jgi:outer membrane receptor for ferrienterochelin and colicin
MHLIYLVSSAFLILMLLKGVDLYKGDFPAQFGGRLSSVVDVKLKDGNDQCFSGSGGIGAIASRLTLEGPLIKDKSSFMLSGRRTYFDIFTRQLNKANAEKEDYDPIPDYYFYDMNVKVNYELGKRDRLFISGYFGRDIFKFKGDNFNFDFKWGNTTGTLRWNHIFNPRLFSNTSFVVSDYNYSIQNKFDIFKFTLGSSIQDVSGKTDFDYMLNNNHTFRFGAQYTYHNFSVGRLQAGSDDGRVSFNAGQNLFGSQMGMYASSDWSPDTQWRLQQWFPYIGL